MEKENFRILLDLSDVQDRVHNFVWMLISTIDLKYIADLKNAIITKLDLDRNDVKLFMNGGLLLEEEKIIILKENDTVQIQYEKLPDSFCRNSSLMEVQDSRLSLNAEKCNGNKIHSKKNKRRSEGMMSDLSIAEENQKLIQHEILPNPFHHDSSCMEVDNQRLSLNAEKYHGNKISEHSKKNKRKSEIYDLPIAEKNKTLYETLKDSSIHNSSFVEVEDNKLSINAEICNRIKIPKHSKKHKKRSEGDNLYIVEENTDINLSKNKRKRDVASFDTFDKIENKIQVESPPLNNDATEENISNSKKRNKSSYATTTKNIIVSNESDNKVEINNVPVVSDVSISLIKPENTINLEENEDNKTTVISIDSFVQGNNCKKRKRKRNRKRKIGTNLLGPFMSANISTFQNFIKDDSKALSPCDEYTGIRKHIKFTSPNQKSIAKEIEAVEPEINYSSSQFESSPIKTCPPPTSQFPSLLESIAHANEIANKVSLKFCTVPNSICISPGTKMPSLTINNEFPHKTYTMPGSTNFLLSTKPTFNSTINGTEDLAEQKFGDQNSWTVSPVQEENVTESYQISTSINEDPVKHSAPSYTDYPLIKVLPPMGTHIAFKLLELGENYSPEVSDYKEGIIKSMNPDYDELEIELIDIEIKPGRTGKFENLKEDEEPSEEVIKKVMVQWSSLIEPRIISPNSKKNK